MLCLSHCSSLVSENNDSDLNFNEHDEEEVSDRHNPLDKMEVNCNEAPHIPAFYILAPYKLSSIVMK